MVFEKGIKRNNLKTLTYFIGAMLEVLGFALLFAFDRTISIISQSPFILAVLFIVSGYIVAVSVRKK